MKPFAGSSSRTRTALLLLTLSGVVAGCGVVYTPQEFKQSSLTYGYKGGFETDIEVVTMTFMSARLANGDGYVSRSLPDIFSQTDPVSTVSTRARIAAAGLDVVDPAFVLDPPVRSAPYDAGRDVLPPALRNEGQAPLSLPTPPSVSVPDYTPRTPASSTVFSGNSPDAAPPRFDDDADIDMRLERPQLRRRAAGNPIPDIRPSPYRIGSGDVVALRLRSVSPAEQGDASRLLVQDSGEIFLPDIGAITVEGLTLREARQLIDDRLVASSLGFDAGMQIVTFGSKSIAVSGLSSSQLIPLNVRPTTLGEAMISTGGFGSNPSDTIVRVLREGKVYEMNGDQLLGDEQIARRILLDGDIVSVSTGYDPESALAYFDQQIQLRAIERSRYENNLARYNAAREARDEARGAARQARQDALGAETLERERIKFQIELDTYRIEAERLRQEAEIERVREQRATAQFNEDARIANIEARQAYLDRLRELEQLNRADIRDTQAAARDTMLANRAERARERADRRALLELELQEERLRLQQLTDERGQARDLFNQRVALGAEARDYVTVAGETQQQTTMPIPFNGRLTLNRVLYEEANGINLLSGDTSEIYVIRTPREDRIRDKITAYHLDASNPAALAVASVFEMRPNDVVYVNPQPITKWNRVLTQILPSTGLLQSGAASVLN